jgi:hypothetical protein
MSRWFTIDSGDRSLSMWALVRSAVSPWPL